MRVHLINLYQRGEVKRKMIEKKHLKKCKLAFWFCESIDNKYERVSPISYSDEIEECKILKLLIVESSNFVLYYSHDKS